MKKSLLAILLALAIGLAGCSSNEGDKGSNPSNEPTNQSPEDLPWIH